MAKTVKPKTKATTPAKKKVVKKQVKPAAKQATKKQVASKKATAQQPFFEVKLTDQSLYWSIFGIVSIAFAFWIYTLDAKVRDLYDQIDQSTYHHDTIMIPNGTTTETADEDAAQE